MSLLDIFIDLIFLVVWVWVDGYIVYFGFVRKTDMGKGLLSVCGVCITDCERRRSLWALVG
ncbi:hypothetical protein AAHH80_32230, partial [Burkholderia pseudomallei]